MVLLVSDAMHSNACDKRLAGPAPSEDLSLRPSSRIYLSPLLCSALSLISVCCVGCTFCAMMPLQMGDVKEDSSDIHRHRYLFISQKGSTISVGPYPLTIEIETLAYCSVCLCVWLRWQYWLSSTGLVKLYLVNGTIPRPLKYDWARTADVLFRPPLPCESVALTCAGQIRSKLHSGSRSGIHGVRSRSLSLFI